MAGGSLTQMFQAILLGPWITATGRLLAGKKGKKMCSVTAEANPKDLVIIKELMEAGKVVPVIDRRYPLSGVPDALQYLWEGHAQGKVVINIQ
jgi:NADPH:quinone reductase-like Zn-dependent oxidoreductase